MSLIAEDDLQDVSPTERISRLLDAVQPDSPRHDALDAALDFKGSWIVLAGHLKVVEDDEAWKDWEYASFKRYCKKELQLSRGEIRKLRDGYAWLETEAPELIDGSKGGGDQDDAGSGQPPLDIDTVDQLAKGYREYERERIPADTYRDLKQAALRGERSSYQLRRQFKEAVPDDLRETTAPNPRKHLKRALKSLEKALAEIEQSGADAAEVSLVEQTRKLRDDMFHLVATNDDNS